MAVNDDDDSIFFLSPLELTDEEWDLIRAKAQRHFDDGEKNQLRAAVKGYYDFITDSTEYTTVH